jgi:hypothetical protein
MCSLHWKSRWQPLPNFQRTLAIEPGPSVSVCVYAQHDTTPPPFACSIRSPLASIANGEGEILQRCHDNLAEQCDHRDDALTLCLLG